mgnify:FL=1
MNIIMVAIVIAIMEIIEIQMLNDEKCNKISLSSGRQFFIKLSTICANIECLPADPSEDNKREREVEDLRKRLSVMIYSCRRMKRLKLYMRTWGCTQIFNLNFIFSEVCQPLFF